VEECSTRGRDEKYRQNFAENLVRKRPFGRLNIDGR
jgi:hypothetical protein